MSELRQRKMSNCVYRIGVGRSRLGAAAAMGTAVLSLLAFTSACTEQAACPPGSEWEDPNDPDNLSCIDKTNDDGGSGGLGGGVNAGGSVNAGGVNAGAANAGAANAGGANAGGNTMSAGGSGASDTGTGGTIDLGRCGGTADQSQDAYDGWDFTDLRPLAQSCPVVCT